MTGYDKPLTPNRIATAKDKDIDFTDVPELDEAFWREAELAEPDLTEQIGNRAECPKPGEARRPGKR